MVATIKKAKPATKTAGSKTLEELCAIGQKYMARHGMIDNHTASFCGVRDTGSVDDSGLRGACHYSLRRMSGSVRVVVTLVRPSSSKKDRQLEWLGWLLNDSLFSLMYITKDPEEAVKSGICVDGSKPRNLVAASCIASRMCYEKPQLIDVQKALIEKGLNPNFAFVLTGRISKIEEAGHDLVATMGFQSDHHVVSGFGFSETSLRNAVTGVFDDKRVGRPFMEDAGYEGITQIWGPTETGQDRCRLNRLVKECVTEKEVVLNSAKEKNANPWSFRPQVKKVKLLDTEKMKDKMEKLLK